MSKTMLVVKDTMSSVEIAELSGKLHKNVLEAIRKMEESWVKLGQPNFKPSYYSNSQGKKQPCFELTKTDLTAVMMEF
jgi:anti-repressor protein